MPDEEPVLLAHSAGPNRVLRQVIVDLHAPVFQITRQRAPFGQCVSHCLAQRTLRQALVQLPFQPRLQRRQYRGGLLLAQRFALNGIELLFPRVPLDQGLKPTLDWYWSNAQLAPKA